MLFVVETREIRRREEDVFFVLSSHVIRRGVITSANCCKRGGEVGIHSGRERVTDREAIMGFGAAGMEKLERGPHLARVAIDAAEVFILRFVDRRNQISGRESSPALPSFNTFAVRERESVPVLIVELFSFVWRHEVSEGGGMGVRSKWGKTSSTTGEGGSSPASISGQGGGRLLGGRLPEVLQVKVVVQRVVSHWSLRFEGGRPRGGRLS
ncbi:hypothetical protein R3P38DRAFT_2810677 [Favolaschia claudopus]|uniref:Uncharacterized protein n=1 Tax=Favolaschia claudopus TaxID=2862362 RepID=A0AAV9ZB95_9AGAR